jgi:hypothetical protein
MCLSFIANVKFFVGYLYRENGNTVIITNHLIYDVSIIYSLSKTDTYKAKLLTVNQITFIYKVQTFMWCSVG